MLRRLLYVLCGLTLAVSACKHDAPTPVNTSDGNYPEAVSKIIMGKCVSCHNAANYTASGGLRLDTWAHMFEGGTNGAAVVAYSADYSPLLYFINTDPALGVVSEPRMPNGQNDQPLSRDEYITIRDWIANGAPDKNGNIPFASEAATRQKVYMTLQSCDLLGVVDAQTNTIMRYISVGKEGISDVPHAVRFTEDGKYAFVSLYAGNGIVKVDATTDQVVSTESLPVGQWNIVYPSPDGTKFLATDFIGGNLVYFDYTDNTKKKFIPGFAGPHGVAGNASFDTFYVAAQTGNMLYKTTKNGVIANISLDGNPPTTQVSSKDPHEILMSLDNSKYFVTCQKSNQLVVMDHATDKPIKTIQLGTFPQEMAISKKQPYLFVSCMEDNIRKVGNITYKGSVYVINYNTLEVVRVIQGNFSAVHGITVDDKNDRIYIASRNPEGADGPTPHHTTKCGSRNGYYNVYSLTTLEPAPDKRYEVTPDPYSVDVRFK